MSSNSRVSNLEKVKQSELDKMGQNTQLFIEIGNFFGQQVDMFFGAFVKHAIHR